MVVILNAGAGNVARSGNLQSMIAGLFGQPNSLNVIQTELPVTTIARYHWQSKRGAFDLFSTERFVRTGNGWTPA